MWLKAKTGFIGKGDESFMDKESTKESSVQSTVKKETQNITKDLSLQLSTSISDMDHGQNKDV